MIATFNEYQRLGGKAPFEDLKILVYNFAKYTQVMFVGGESTTITRVNGKPLWVGSRDVAMKYFIKDCCRGDHEEGYRVYQAVDSVVSWT